MRQLPLRPLRSRAANPSTITSPGRTPRRSRRVRALAHGLLSEAIVYLWGGPGSGRTHLLRAAARANPQLVIADDVDATRRSGSAGAFRRHQRRPRRRSSRARRRQCAAGAASACARTCARAWRWGLVYHLKPLVDADKAAHLRGEAQRRGLSALRRGGLVPPDPPAARPREPPCGARSAGPALARAPARGDAGAGSRGLVRK